MQKESLIKGQGELQESAMAPAEGVQVVAKLLGPPGSDSSGSDP